MSITASNSMIKKGLAFAELPERATMKEQKQIIITKTMNALV